MKGYFIVSENQSQKFDIKCELRPDIEDDVPEEQSLLYANVENTCNVIKALNKTTEDIKQKYFDKLLSLAQVGLVPECGAQPQMAMLSLEKLKAEMLLVEGKRIKNQYMRRLGITASILAGIIGVIAAVCYGITKLNAFSMIGYTWLGAMAGAWVSYGARKFHLAFEDMALMEKDMLEPVIRLIYIGICALIFELFLSCGIATVTVGSITTSGLASDIQTQILIGVLCGLIESKIGIDIYKKANSTLAVIEDVEK
ncbi:MAG: hypothetical protein ACLUFH_06890 [Monoglobales bacterium]